MVLGKICVDLSHSCHLQSANAEALGVETRLIVGCELQNRMALKPELDM